MFEMTPSNRSSSLCLLLVMERIITGEAQSQTPVRGAWMLIYTGCSEPKSSLSTNEYATVWFKTLPSADAEHFAQCLSVSMSPNGYQFESDINYV